MRVFAFVLLFASTASADIMRVQFNETDDGNPNAVVDRLVGRLGAIYDPTFQQINRADVYWHFESSNYGMFGIDSFQTGWLDPFTEEFDITVGILQGPVLPAIWPHTKYENFGPNGTFRLAHTLEDGDYVSIFERWDENGVLLESRAADIQSVTFNVPEPSAAILFLGSLVLGLFLLGCRR